MRASKSVFVTGLVVFAGACSSAPDASNEGTVAPSAALPEAPVAAPSEGLGAFRGSSDPARGTLDIRAGASAGGLATQATLPYGAAAGKVYFHTCSVSYDSSAHVLAGTVQAVNLTGAVVRSLNAVVDSVSVTGVTLGSGAGAGSPSGVIASYGDVSPNSPDCATNIKVWKFGNPTDAQFGFGGHADGLATIGATCAAILAANPGSPTGSDTRLPRAARRSPPIAI